MVPWSQPPVNTSMPVFATRVPCCSAPVGLLLFIYVLRLRHRRSGIRAYEPPACQHTWAAEIADFASLAMHRWRVCGLNVISGLPRRRLNTIAQDMPLAYL